MRALLGADSPAGGTARPGFHTYDGKLIIVVIGMKQLKEHGQA
ncbi:hypothetical protein [Streptomyces griseofuscus]|nr:hypothetical protein [Streptomyces griseofuscus]